MRSSTFIALGLALTFGLASSAQPGGDSLKAATMGTPAPGTPVVTEPVTPPLYSPPLSQAVAAYRAAPSPQSFGEVLRVLKAIIVSPPGQKASASAIIKQNPALVELGARVLDAGQGRLWLFNRVTHGSEALLQWFEIRSTSVKVKRRIVVTHAVSNKFDTLHLTPGVILREARIVGAKEAPHMLILSGELQGQLYLRAFVQQDGVWHEEEGHFASLPAFLTQNVSGKVTFLGSDLVFIVARMPQRPAPNAPPLPEADSSTYKFWLHYADGKYSLQSRVPSEAEYAVVYSFLHAVQAGQSEQSKTYLSNPSLVSLPKYLGLSKIPAQPYKVVEMAVPPSGARRFRLVTFGKNDVIFDVGPVKGRTVIKSIFVAPADPFLREMKQYLANYDKFAAPPAPAEGETDTERAK